MSSMSAVKRKREEVDTYPSKMDWSRSSVRTIPLNIEENPSQRGLFVLVDGSILEVTDQSLCLHAKVIVNVITSLHAESYDAVNVVKLSAELLLPNQYREKQSLLVKSCKRQGQQFPEIVCVSPAGTVQFWQPRESGQQIISSFSMLLADIENDEQIRDIVFEDGKVYMLSSLNNIYLVFRDDDKEVQGFHFQRSMSLMAGLWKTGARLLGVNHEDRVGNALKLVTIPENSQLLVIGSKLTVWQNYRNPRRESVLLEMELSAALKSDIAKSLRVPSYSLRIQLLDASVANVTSTTVDLFVLSAFASHGDLQQQFQDQGRNEDVGLGGANILASLHLHQLQISLVPTEHSSTGSNSTPSSHTPLRVLRRYHIADQVFIADETAEASPYVKPQLWMMDIGWRVFVTWTDADKRMVHAVQLDTFHDPATISGATPTKYAMFTVQHGAMNIRVPVSDVGNIGTVQEVDGCVLLQANASQFTLVMPVLTTPLAMNPLKRQVSTLPASASVESLIGFDEQPGTQQPQLEGLMLDKAVTKFSEMLMNIISNKMPLFSRLGYLRNEVLRLPEAQLLSIVKYHSETVINRSPAGRYWGSSLSFRGKSVENKVHELQFAHRVVADKVVVHGHLMQLVWEMYGFQYAGIRDLLLENQDKIALTAAVAEAIEDRMLLIADHEVVRILLEQITQAMEDAVLELSGRSLEDIQSKGLTPYDFFFVDCSKGFELLTNVLHRLTVSITQDHWPPALALQLLQFLVSVFHAADAQGAKAFDEYHQSSSGSFRSDELRKSHDAHLHSGHHKSHLLLRYLPLRDACVTLAQQLLPEIQTRTQGNAALAPNLFESITVSGLGGNREEHWLSAFAESVFSSFVREALNHYVDAAPNTAAEVTSEDVSNRAVESMPRTWKAEYETAKQALVSVMLSLGYHERAFQFSRRFWYFKGLFGAVEMAPSAHKSALDALLVQFGNVRNSAVDKERFFTRQYCEWLERTQQHQRLIVDAEHLTKQQESMSQSSSPHHPPVDNAGILYEFLTGLEKCSSNDVDVMDEAANDDLRVESQSVAFDPHRHHLHMLQCLRRQDYLNVTQAALAHAQTLPALYEQKCILSFGKLAAIVAAGKLSENRTESDGLEEEESMVRALRSQTEEALKLPIIQEQHFSEELQLLPALQQCQRLVHERFVPATEQILFATNPAQALQLQRLSWLRMISHAMILLGYHHGHCASLEESNEALQRSQAQQVQQLLSIIWEKIVEMESLVLEDAVLYKGPITSVQETTLLNTSALAAVVQDVLLGVEEGNLPADFVWPVHSPIEFAAIVQKVISESKTEDTSKDKASSSHPVIETWGQGERERAQMLMQNIIRLALP